MMITIKEEIEELKRVYYLLSLIQPHDENSDSDTNSQQFLDEISDRKENNQEWIERTSVV